LQNGACWCIQLISDAGEVENWEKTFLDWWDKPTLEVLPLSPQRNTFENITFPL